MISNAATRYNIHGFCSFDILDYSGRVLQTLLDVQSRYQCFRVDHDPVVLPDMRIVIGSFEPKLTGCTVLDDSWWVREGYLFHSGETYKMGARWSFDVSGLDGGTIELRIAANMQGRPFIAGKIIDAFVFYLLQQRGCTMLHASAVARDGEAFVFAARGGGGKTTLALAAAFNEGMDFMGDNFVILKDGMIYSCLSDLNMFGYNLQPRVWESLTAYERLRFRGWAMVHSLTLGYIKVFSEVSPLRFLQGSLSNSARIKKLNMLQTHVAFLCEPLARESLIPRMTSNMKMEFFSFVRHAAAYAFCYPESPLAKLWDEYRETLNANLPVDVPLQLITVPELISEQAKTEALMAGTGQGAI
jgi:hypothetical protein